MSATRSHVGKRSGRGCSRSRHGSTARQGAERGVVEHAAARQQGGRLHHPLGSLGVVDVHGPGVWAELPRDHREEGRFSGARWAHDRDGRGSAEPGRYPVEHAASGPRHREVAHRHSHRRSSAAGRTLTRSPVSSSPVTMARPSSPPTTATGSVPGCCWAPGHHTQAAVRPGEHSGGWYHPLVRSGVADSRPATDPASSATSSRSWERSLTCCRSSARANS